MPSPMEFAGVQPVPEWMRETLHGLCQPLMALECQLYLASLGGGDATQLTTVESGLHQCQRMVQLIRAAQTRMASTDQATNVMTQGRSQ